MHSLDNPDQRAQLQHFLAQGDNTFSWVETHGLLCAIAVGPKADDNWGSLIFLEEQAEPPEAIRHALSQQAERIASDLAAGENIRLPCRLDPYAEKDAEDLASWCAGFMSAVLHQEADWYGEREAQSANLLLPILLISGLDEDEALDELWQNSQLVRQMALGLPDLLAELFLHFNAPDLPAD